MSESAQTSRIISVIGGTGALGGGLVRRFARAGFQVIIGSRDAKRAANFAQKISVETGATVAGMANDRAAASGDIVFVTIPFASQAETLRAIASAVHGKIVVDTTVPLQPPRVARVQLPREGSAAAIALAILPSDCHLVTSFHSVSAQKLNDGNEIDADILVFGDVVEARDAVIAAIAALGLSGVHGGPLDNAVAAEAMTSVLISINKRYGVSGGAGIKITGLKEVI